MFMLSSLLLAVSPQTPAVDLSLRVFEGDSWVAEVRQSLRPDVDGDPEEVYVWQDTTTVRLDKRNVKLVTSRKLIESSVGGISIPTDSKAAPWDLASTVSEGRQGEPERTGESDPGEHRLVRLRLLSWPLQPVERKGVWERAFELIPTGWAPAASGRWTFAGMRQKLDRQVGWITYTYSEQGIAQAMTATGELFLDRETGIPLEYDVRAKNAPAPGGDGSPNVFNWRYRVTELRLKQRSRG